jgi:hypothetical protein
LVAVITISWSAQAAKRVFTYCTLGRVRFGNKINAADEFVAQKTNFWFCGIGGFGLLPLKGARNLQLISRDDAPFIEAIDQRSLFCLHI